MKTLYLTSLLFFFVCVCNAQDEVHVHWQKYLGEYGHLNKIIPTSDSGILIAGYTIDSTFKDG